MLDSPNDPAGALAFAARMRAAGDRVAELAHRLEVRMAGLRFEGPAATRLEVAMAENRVRARYVTDELQQLADLAARHVC